jgi:uncharacterized RDD family membrane protein YckC
MAHYELRGQIGFGAMGIVYEADDTALDRLVAVKVLRERIAGDPAIVDRFTREARAAARVNHPNLIHIYFVGRQGDRPFFAMELVPGETLEQAVTARGAMPLAEAVDALVQSARGLAAAHAAGVVHRDVKPSNLIRRPDGTVKVTDFGMAKSMDADVHATGGGSLMGTPTFMSPEQCRGAEVDARCDVYSLGLVAWYLLVGRTAYEATSLGQLLNDQMNTPIPSAVAARPELPPAVDDVLRKLCAKDPAERPASMNEVAALFETLRPRTVTPAPLFARGTAHLIDGAAAVLAGAVVALVLYALGALIAELPIPTPRWLKSFVGVPIMVLSSTAAMAAVLLLPEMWYRTSIGKVLFDLRVVRADGTRPGVVALVGRLVLRFPALVILPLTVVGPIQNVAAFVAVGIQGLSAVVGLTCYFLREEKTLSDLVTRTRVAPRRDVG